MNDKLVAQAFAELQDIKIFFYNKSIEAFTNKVNKRNGFADYSFTYTGLFIFV